jgi:hypothetical protein
VNNSEKYYIKSNLAISNSKEQHITLRAKEYSINQSYLINVLYLLHMDIYLKSTPISKLTALTITLENISCQILRRVHIVAYKLSHQ